MNEGAGLQIGVLGALQVRRGGRPLEVEGGKQRALLLRLLVGDQPVSDDALVDALWSGRPPPSALRSLRAHASRLRSALRESRDEPVLVHGSGGYRIGVPVTLDAMLFEEGVASARRQREDGDPSGAAARLDEALGLWRGEPFAELRYEPFTQAAIARLDSLRLDAWELRAELRLDLGAEQEVVLELEQMVGEHPLRDRLQGLLMLALYRCGRQADALAAYDRAREVQLRELGLEPSPGLRRLHRDILRQAPELLPPRPHRTGDDHSTPVAVPSDMWDRLRDSVEMPPLNGSVRCELLLGRGRALRTTGRVAESRLAYTAAVRAALTDGTAEQLASGVLGLAGPPEDTLLGVPFDGSLAESALLRLPAGESAARKLRARIGMDLVDRGEPERGEQAITAVIAESRAHRDLEALAYALRARHRSWFDPLAVDERLATSEELVRIGEQLANAEILAWGHRWRGINLVETGALDEVVACLDALEQVAGTQDAAFHRWGVVVRGAGREILRMPTQKSEILVLEALALTDEVRSELTTTGAALLLWALRFLQGRMREVHRVATDLAAAHPVAAAMLPFAHAEQGDMFAARETFEPLAVEGFGPALRRDPIQVGRLLTLALLAETASTLRDADRAAVLYNHLTPLAGRLAAMPTGISALTSVDHCLGRLAATLGDPDRASRHFDQALAAYQRIDAGVLAPRTQLAYAQVLRGSRDTRDRAASLAKDALDRSAGLGLGHPTSLLTGFA